MYADLELIKRHLNIDASYTAEDVYLTYLYNVAEGVVEKHLDIPLEYIEDTNGTLPAPIVHAMLLQIGNAYNFRESEIVGTTNQVGNSYDYLLSMFKDYSGLYSGETYKSIVDEVLRHMIIRDGELIFDPDFVERCSHIEDKKGEAYTRIMNRIAATATIDASGNLIISY